MAIVYQDLKAFFPLKLKSYMSRSNFGASATQLARREIGNLLKIINRVCYSYYYILYTVFLLYLYLYLCILSYEINYSMTYYEGCSTYNPFQTTLYTNTYFFTDVDHMKFMKHFTIKHTILSYTS